MSVADTPILPVPPQAKVDPESLVLRAQPTKAIRFRRSAIIGIAALGSASLMGVAWMALKPQVFRHVAQESELSKPSTNPSDALAGLPAGYWDTRWARARPSKPSSSQSSSAMEQAHGLPAIAGRRRSMNGLSNAALCATMISADARISTAAASSTAWPARSSAVSPVNFVILGSIEVPGSSRQTRGTPTWITRPKSSNRKRWTASSMILSESRSRPVVSTSTATPILWVPMDQRHETP